MRKINKIIIHCSDTYPNMDVTADDIRGWHVSGNKWSDIGYHFVIRRSGEVEPGRDLDGDGDVIEEVGAHAKGFNVNSIGICLVGGKGVNNQPQANFTFEQYRALRRVVAGHLRQFGLSIDDVVGHRDLPGVSKACPCFDVAGLFQNLEVAR